MRQEIIDMFNAKLKEIVNNDMCPIIDDFIALYPSEIRNDINKYVEKARIINEAFYTDENTYTMGKYIVQFSSHLIDYASYSKNEMIIGKMKCGGEWYLIAGKVMQMPRASFMTFCCKEACEVFIKQFGIEFYNLTSGDNAISLY